MFKLVHYYIKDISVWNFPPYKIKTITSQVMMVKAALREQQTWHSLVWKCQVIPLKLRCLLTFSLMEVKISNGHLLFPPWATHCLPLYPTDGTLRHWVGSPKTAQSRRAIQGKPSLHWHSFEHASRTTSHGPEQKNVDFSQSFYSSMAGLDLIGRGPLYLLLYITVFSAAAC